MKWTIFKVKSNNLYDNHREKHKRTPAAALPTIALAQFCKTGGHIALARGSAHKGGRHIFFLHKPMAVNTGGRVYRAGAV